MAIRLICLIVAGLSLVLGIWSGLARLSWVIPAMAPHHLPAHGPLMIGGFLGCLISLERARAVPYLWSYLAPCLAGASTLWTLAHPAWQVSAWLLTTASGLAVATSLVLLRQEASLPRWTLTVATTAWLVGNLLWVMTSLVPIAVPFWTSFVTLYFVGKRLDRAPGQSVAQLETLVLGVSLLVLLFGSSRFLVDPHQGLRVVGIGFFGFAVWGSSWDVRRPTSNSVRAWQIFHLFAAYGWLAIAGAILLLADEPMSTGAWDAALHALSLGFVFSMILAHLSDAIRAGLRSKIEQVVLFLIPSLLLQASLALRIWGDLAGLRDLRTIGAAFNMVALALLLLVTLRNLVKAWAQDPPG